MDGSIIRLDKLLVISYLSGTSRWRWRLRVLFHHHHEKKPSSVPAAKPADAPAVDVIADLRRLKEPVGIWSVDS
jgi:hypothetical protein